jgi:hypothetical protein
MNPEDEVEPEVERARNAAKALKELTTSKGWAILKTIIEKQIQARTDKIIFEPRSSNKMTEFEYEFMKGEAAGMRTILHLAESEYETEAAVAGARANE